MKTKCEHKNRVLHIYKHINNLYWFEGVEIVDSIENESKDSDDYVRIFCKDCGFNAIYRKNDIIPDWVLNLLFIVKYNF